MLWALTPARVLCHAFRCDPRTLRPRTRLPEEKTAVMPSVICNHHTDKKASTFAVSTLSCAVPSPFHTLIVGPLTVSHSLLPATANLSFCNAGPNAQILLCISYLCKPKTHCYGCRAVSAHRAHIAAVSEASRSCKGRGGSGAKCVLLCGRWPPLRLQDALQCLRSLHRRQQWLGGCLCCASLVAH